MGSPIHAGQSTNMREDVLNCIRELERVDIPQTKLHMSVDDEFRQPQDFSAQMERIAETRLLSLLRGESLDWLEIHVLQEYLSQPSQVDKPCDGRLT
jgi:hypothetical protein